ncbi:PBP1A family penicillin-binding protein [Candidatus Lariskella endosymbiont of Epinotia ramella]|uniref:penicillin-binding protein 1A n=1 Tax=Candidatus Lariskella endosymbiont of Epinotia ramella TaxID=3066224 RepID=UPI0030D41763
MLNSIVKWAAFLFGVCLLFVIFSLQLIIFFSHDLPDYQQLADYDPPGITRLYSHSGEVLSEYAIEKRTFVPISEVPTIVINAFLAAEDKNFFQHPGVDLYSTIRAAIQSVLNLAASKRVVGGSTITQQVVKDFLLTNERSISRKIKEAILAYRISKIYSKHRILELYLNQIFLGNNSYGIVTAAQNYFDKDLKDLNIAEAAMLAALPKAPSTLNPFTNYSKAKIRRDWVIERMAEEEMITDREAAKYIKQKILLRTKRMLQEHGESFYTESVKQELVKMFGEHDVVSKGFVVNTNLDIELQRFADESFKKGLIGYDKKHGWRGPIDKISSSEIANWQNVISRYSAVAIENNLDVAIVLKIANNRAIIGLPNSSQGFIAFDDVKWARKNLKNQTLGPQLNSISEVLNAGHVIFVKNIEGDKYTLEQVPDVEGGMVVMEPYTGKVLAMVGGFNGNKTYFNRAIQAERQPGSVFKPLVYLAALEQNIQPNTIILDEPISVSQGKGMPNWSPKNYNANFLGPITLRTALEKSRNTPTVRIMLTVGLPSIIELANRFGVYKKSKAAYSIALGAFETTLMEITNAYNTVASGGLAVTPKLIESIYDRRGNMIYRSEDIICKSCTSDLISSIADGSIYEDAELPDIEYPTYRLVDTDTNYQFVSLLEGAMRRGTGAKANVLGIPVAGKTGTTNDSFDAWFVGFTPYIIVGVYVGFDKPRTLGARETGSTVALPIFIDFMQKACAKMPALEFAVPDGIALKAVNKRTGRVLEEEDYEVAKSDIIIEAFKKNHSWSHAFRDRSEENLEESIPHYNLGEILSTLDEEE